MREHERAYPVRLLVAQDGKAIPKNGKVGAPVERRRPIGYQFCSGSGNRAD